MSQTVTLLLFIKQVQTLRGMGDIRKGQERQGLVWTHTALTWVRGCGLREWALSLLPQQAEKVLALVQRGVNKTPLGEKKCYFLIHKEKKLMSEKISYTQKNLFNQLGLQIA